MCDRGQTRPRRTETTMCGIVGLFLKKDDLRPRLGDMLTDMLITMTDRGPDSGTDLR